MTKAKEESKKKTQKPKKISGSLETKQTKEILLKKPIKKQEKKKIQIAKNPKEQNKSEIVEKKLVKKNKQKMNRFFRSQPKQTEEESSVIYIGHLPYGFVEEGLKDFFTQFGEIKKVKLARSKKFSQFIKTSRSKGYGFVEFELPEVAQIAAETMNGYFLESRQLICEKLKNLQPNPFDFPTSKKYKFIPWKKIYIKQKNSVQNSKNIIQMLILKLKSDEQIKMHISQLVKNEEQKKEKIKELGIDYDFPGFSSIINTLKQSMPKKVKSKIK